ncbi:MAG: S-layer homology domain-containing protein [Oscillospiraceae bacterium]|nr:S-layer homology domain-containing protein [Oscillospiraceae bacterium]
MKKLTSLLLALVMVFSMLPGTALTVAAAGEDEAIVANYTAAAPTVDGKLDETLWLLRDRIGSVPVTVVTNVDKLFIGMKTNEAKAAFTVNEVAVEVDLDGKVVLVGGEKVGVCAKDDVAGTAEVEIPLSAVNMIYAVKQQIPFAATVGSDSYSGELAYAYGELKIADSFDNLAARPYAKNLALDKTTQEIYTTQAEGGLQYKTGTLTQTGGMLNYPNWNAGVIDTAIGWEMSFTADFNDLPVADELGYLALCGFSIDIRAEEYVRIGFFADNQDNVRVSLYDEPADLTKNFDTGVDLGAKNVDVRIVVNDDFTSEVFVNGKSVANFPTATRTTGVTGAVYLSATTLRRDESKDNKTDVVIHDFLLTQAAPAAQLPVSMASGLKQDGTLDEPFWTMNAVKQSQFGLLCDEQYLYIALATTQSSAAFDINGAKATAKLGSKPTFALGYTMGSTIKGGNNEYEIAIPLKLLGIDKPVGQKTAFAITIDGVTREYELSVGGGATLSVVEREVAPGDGKMDAIAYLDTAGLVLDGKVKENQWYTPYQTQGAKGGLPADIGFLWDSYNLYVGGQVFSASRAKKLELTVGGKNLTADLSAKTADAGVILTAGQTFEWRVPLTALGIDNPLNHKTTYKLNVVGTDGTSAIQGNLSLMGKVVVWGDTCGDFTAKSYTVTSNTVHTRQSQGNGAYVVTTDPALGNANEMIQYYTLLNFEGGAYEFTVDMNIKDVAAYDATLGWRGMCWEIRQPELQTRFNFRNDGKGNILMDILYHMHVETAETGIKLGERATFTVKVDDNLMPALYVNGQFIKGFSRLDRTSFTIADNIPMPRMIVQPQNYGRALNADGSLGKLDVEVYDVLWTQEPYVDSKAIVDNAAATLTAEYILAGADGEDVTKLRLPKELVVSDLGISCPVKWTAIDAATGMSAKNVNVDTGVITRGSEPLLLTLMANISYGGTGVTRTFQFQTKGIASIGKVAMIYGDNDPLTGEATNWSDNSYQYFDTEHNSLVLDQGSSKQFNRIVLHDNDDFSRVAQRHLGVFVSEDGKSWTKITGWLLHQDGPDYTLYNLNAKARYVKVHSYHDNLSVVDYEPSFYNIVPNMITVSNEPNLPGAGGAFARKAEVKVTSGEKDSPVFISLAQLGAKAGQYKADCSDFRFTVGDTVLAHWYNGKDGFYVRVPAVPATVTAQWGCGSAKDFSDAEAVFEVTYGNVSCIDISGTTGMGTHGRPITLSNGDIIVVGRQASTRGDLAYVRSTDGGRTFNKQPEVAMRDADNKGRALGYGGFIYNEKIDRLFLFAYSGSGKDANDYRIVITYTDDCAKTWSTPLYLRGADAEPFMNDTVINNYPDYLGRTVFYGDGLTLSTYDGEGPNIDYVFSTGDKNMENSHNVAIAIFSADGGKTWTASDTILTMNLGGGEFGLSETSLAELDNGDIYLVSRAQQDGNLYLWEATSKDQGKTWTQGYSKIISSNTSPVLARYGEDRLVLHSSRNSLGADVYRRTPMHIGVSSDNYATFDRYIDLTLGTSFDALKEREHRMTQPGIAFSADGKEAFVCWFDHYWLAHGESFAPGVPPYRSGATGTIGFLVEEFDELVYDSKGAYDDFEVSYLKYQGWLCDTSATINLSKKESASGLYSMQVLDNNAGGATHAAREVPAMKAGTVGAKVMVSSANTNDFALELKAAFNETFLRHTLAAVAFSPDGTISLCYEDGKVAVGKVAPDTWFDVAISFDIAADTGTLYIDGEKISDIKLKHDQTMEVSMVGSTTATGETTAIHHTDVIREIISVMFTQTEANAHNGGCIYVDDFYATELKTPIVRAMQSVSVADVKENDWFYDAVSFAVDNELMSGYNATKFGPNDTLNRAMVVQVLYNKEGQPDLKGMKHNFSDVPASQWFNNAVTWGSNRGVVSGFGGGIFKPEDAVTIEQVAVILWNYSHTPEGYGELSGVGKYSDWAANALRWCVDKGILENVPFTNVTEKATRAQTAQMLTNFLRSI